MMSSAQREWITGWAPMILTIIANLVLVAYGYGQLQQRLTPIEKHAAESESVYVRRVEYVQKTTDRDREMRDLKDDLRAISDKLDRIIERQSRE
jgi:hypothetical protein